MKFTKTRITFIVFVVLAGIIIAYLSTVNYESRVVLGGKVFKVDVADTSYTLTKGLSGRESLANDEGMIFVFGKPDNYGIWMKDMNFPIDIIWIDENNIIISMEKSVSPQTYPKVFYPERLALYVLEIPAGQSDLLKIRVGDKVDFLYKNSI